MMDERTIQRINKEIDGLTTPSEHEELMVFLKANDEALALYEGLLRITKALSSVEDVDPPPSLKHHLMNAIRSAPAHRRGRLDWLADLAEVLGGRAPVRYALVIASGVCAGILFLVLANPWQQKVSSDTTNLIGTMISPAEINRLALVDAEQISNGGVEGTFKVYRGGGSVFVEISTQSHENVNIEFNTDPAQLAFGGIRRLGEAEGYVNVTQGKVLLTDLQHDKTVLIYSERGPVLRNMEGRVYSRNVLIACVTLKVD